ncbi:hypothetical protein C2S51_001162 [Perilla frutescens var. frutescens]|nr:hypothetical protein C2S51_001162 [Perilla frutescens var. frutescens]
MEDQEQESRSRSSRGSEGDQRCEPVRSRWTPKPEQILILESIFNSGMVNPPKEETVRIRKLLEKFGSVGDANVFYWFQNRRSRSRRRERQIQASLSAAGEQPRSNYEHSVAGGYINQAALSSYPISSSPSSSSSSQLGGPGSLSFGLVGNVDAANADGFFSFLGQQELHHHNSFFDSSNLHFQSGVITVFINGVATEVGRGPVDVKTMFGGDYVLVNSSGVAVEVNHHGFLVQTLQHGSKTFLSYRSGWSFVLLYNFESKI